MSATATPQEEGFIPAPPIAVEHETCLEAPSTYFQMVVGDVDVKVKIVAVGQPSEAVSVYCTQTGATRQAWDGEVEAQAQNLLEIVRQSFNSSDFKTIPLMARNCAGLKIHRACDAYRWASRRAMHPADETMEIFTLMQQILEDLASDPETLQVQQGRQSRHSFHSRVSHQSMRNEITRILNGNGAHEAKINSLMRLIDRSTVH